MPSLPERRAPSDGVTAAIVRGPHRTISPSWALRPGWDLEGASASHRPAIRSSAAYWSAPSGPIILPASKRIAGGHDYRNTHYYTFFHRILSFPLLF